MREIEDKEIKYQQKKGEHIIDDLRLFQHHIKMKNQNITNLLDTKSDSLSRFITKKGIVVYDQFRNSENR